MSIHFGTFTPPAVTDPLAGLVSDGLVGYWDSYPGSGDIWYDLSGKGNNFKLYNSPTYNGGTDKSFSFSGSSQYGQAVWDHLNFPFGGAAFSISAFFTITSGATGVNMFGIGGNDWNGGRGCLATYSSTISFETRNSGMFGYAISAATWYHVTVVLPTGVSPTVSATMYINGSSVATSTDSVPVNIQALDCCLGTIPGYPYTAWWNGKIGSPMLYNRALSATEVSQNFNYLKGRYGL